MGKLLKIERCLDSNHKISYVGRSADGKLHLFNNEYNSTLLQVIYVELSRTVHEYTHNRVITSSLKKYSNTPWGSISIY